MKFASIVVLSFNRPDYLMKSLVSLHENTVFPYELIVVDDGSRDAKARQMIYVMIEQRWVSSAIFNCGRNIGIGAGINRGFGIARGDYLLKMDSDLEYKEGWLTEAVALLDTFPEIGVLGLFHYYHDPCDCRKEHIEYRERAGIKVEIVNDFVGSCMVMRQEIYKNHGPFIEEGRSFAEDVAYKEMLQERGYLLGLPLEDKVINVGFGEQHSSLIKKVGTIGDSSSHEYWLPTKDRLIFKQGKAVSINV